MTGLYINTPNLYLCLLKGKVLNFQSLLDFCGTIGDVAVKRAYVVSSDSTIDFENFLTGLDFEVQSIPFKYPNLAYHLFDSDITVDILRDVNKHKLKKVIIVSSTSNYTKLIKMLVRSDVSVVMLGSTTYLHENIGVRHFRIPPPWILE